MAGDPYQEKESGSRDQRKVVRIPLAGNSLNRDSTTTKDQRFINCYPETSKNVVSNTRKLFLVKRPGLVLSQYIGGTAGQAARGLWGFFGNLYTVIGDKLYSGTTPLKTLRSSTGTCGMTQISPTEVFFCDGTDGYTVTSGGTVTEVERAYLRWRANTIVEVGDKYIPTGATHDMSGATYTYYAVQSITGTGQTGSSEPTWNNTIGATTTDNEVTWVAVAVRTVSEVARKWLANYAFTVGQFTTPTTENSIYYKVTASDGAAGVTEPTWPLAIGESVTQDGVTYEAMGYYGGFPSPHIPTPVFMDGYICLAESNSVDFYNSGINDAYSWSPLDFTSAENYPDPIVALARQNNFIVAFGEDNTELFYDAANDTGSPFSRNENYLLQVGLYSANAIFQAEKYLVWVGKSDTGRPSVWSLNGYEAKEISTEYIERILALETTGSNITGYGIRLDGHVFFIINLPVANKTLVYDLEEEMWHEWTYNGVVFPFNFYTYSGNRPYVLHNTNRTLYYFSTTSYKDDTIDIPVSITMLKQDFDNSKRKFFHRVDIVGDQSNTSVNLSWSDDDYQTFNTPVSISMLTRPYYVRNGTSRRRAWRITHTDNTALRLEALEVTYTQGRT